MGGIPMPRRVKRQKLSGVVKFFAWLFTILMIAGFAYVIYGAIMLQIFSDIQIGVVAGFLALVFIFVVWGMFRRRTGTASRVILMLLALLLSGTTMLGGYYIQQTSGFFSSIGTSDPVAETTDEDKKENSEANEIINNAGALSEKMAITLTTYSRKTAEAYKPSDLSGRNVGIVSVLDEEGTQDAIKQLESKGMKNANLVEYPDQFSMVDAMYADQLDAIVLPEQFHSDLLEAANDYNRYNALTTFSNTIDQYIYYDEIPEDMKNDPDSVKDITKDPFIVMISGSDSYGTLSGKSRTDVNMLAVVNPVSHEVLLVSLPRDSYMPFSCKKNETACGYAAGQYDKLTHSGVYGIGTTESSIEDFLGIEINYTVQVNFSSLINVVDAIGGINVNVEPGLAVETFYSNGTEGVHEGMNHLDGERALAFARERHAYLDGDNQRIKNQQIVMKALMKQMMSPTMLMNYPNFLRALSTAFTTNMPSSQIRDLIRLEVSSFPNWNIQSYALAGDSSEQMCAALNSVAFVTLVYENDIQTAHELITDVLQGRKPEVPEQSSAGTETRGPEDSLVDTGEPLNIPQYTPSYDAPVYDDPVYDDPQSPVDPIPDAPVEDPMFPDTGYPEETPVE